jgi:hypothetical protein
VDVSTCHRLRNRLSVAAANHEYHRVPITVRLPSDQPILANALMSRNLKTRRKNRVRSDDVSRGTTFHFSLGEGIIAREAKHGSADLKTCSACELRSLPHLEHL